MKRPKWKRMGLLLLTAAFLFTAGCGQVAEQPAGPIPDPGPSHGTETDPPAQLPESTPTPEPEYDVFSDPNVLWGTEGDTAPDDMFSLPPGSVAIGRELSELLALAGDDDLIAFRLVSESRVPIDAERIVLHEDLKQDEGVMYWLEHADAYESSLEIRRAAHNILDRIEEEMYWIRGDKYVWLLYEKWDGGIPYEDRVTFQQELDELLMADERYCQLSERYAHYEPIVSELIRGVWLQEKETIRNLFIERGFIPIYAFELDEILDADLDEIYSFVGTADQIMQIENMIGENECYHILSVSEPMSADL